MADGKCFLVLKEARDDHDLFGKQGMRHAEADSNLSR